MQQDNKQEKQPLILPKKKGRNWVSSSVNSLFCSLASSKTHLSACVLLNGTICPGTSVPPLASFYLSFYKALKKKEPETYRIIGCLSVGGRPVESITTEDGRSDYRFVQRKVSSQAVHFNLFVHDLKKNKAIIIEPCIWTNYKNYHAWFKKQLRTDFPDIQVSVIRIPFYLNSYSCGPAVVKLAELVAQEPFIDIERINYSWVRRQLEAQGFVFQAPGTRFYEQNQEHYDEEGRYLDAVSVELLERDMLAKVLEYEESESEGCKRPARYDETSRDDLEQMALRVSADRPYSPLCNTKQYRFRSPEHGGRALAQPRAQFLLILGVSVFAALLAEVLVESGAFEPSFLLNVMNIHGAALIVSAAVWLGVELFLGLVALGMYYLSTPNRPVNENYREHPNIPLYLLEESPTASLPIMTSMHGSAPTQCLHSG